MRGSDSERLDVRHNPTRVAVILRATGGRHAGDHKKNRPASHRAANPGEVVANPGEVVALQPHDWPPTWVRLSGCRRSVLADAVQVFTSR
jgi:hypothetical protein